MTTARRQLLFGRADEVSQLYFVKWYSYCRPVAAAGECERRLTSLLMKISTLPTNINLVKS